MKFVAGRVFSPSYNMLQKTNGGWVREVCVGYDFHAFTAPIPVFLRFILKVWRGNVFTLSARAAYHSG